MTQTQPPTADTTDLKSGSRTFSWTRPGTYFAELAGLNGLEQLQALAEGRIPRPPVMEMLDFTGYEPEYGRVVVTMRAQEFQYNPLGCVHGGVLATLLDTAAGSAVHTMLAPGEIYTSLDLSTKFLRPVTVRSGLLRCEGSVVSRGRRTALAQAQVTDEQGRLVAHATSSCMILPASEVPA